ncbi:serine/threonine protein kinase [Friedmanniomyces endolithicus]|nr:serine/threonine protein kinase [Friedmanniomyces endolithicus]
MVIARTDRMTRAEKLSYGQQVALKPRLTNRVQAGLVVFDIVSADRHFEPAALSKLEAARSKAHGALGLRRLKKLRKETPRFSHKLTDWNTLQDIPWQNGGVYKLFNTVLGVGRYSTVRKARREVPDYQTVAVKIIGAGVIADERRSNRELQENELRIMLELEHVNIVRLVDFAVYDAAPFATLLALERATHGTLRNVFLARVDEDMCRTVTGQVLAGLQYLHKQNIIHRDINPSRY